MTDKADPPGARHWAPDPVTDNMGIRREEAASGEINATLDATAEAHCNVFGVVHGAVLFAMADVSMGATVTRALTTFRQVSTISIHSSYLRPAKPGRIVAETKMIRLGRRIATLETNVRDDSGELCALFLGSFHISSA